MISGAVSRGGPLRTLGNRVVDRHGRPFLLRGMSLFWSQWMPQFYCAGTVKWLHRDWGSNAVRTAVAVGYGGYRENPEAEWEKVARVVEAAVAEDMYVVVDWHTHEPEPEPAAEFFGRLAQAYAGLPHLVYEIWNEPYPRYDWHRDIRPYCEALVPVIRAHAPDSLIIVGTPNYSQRPDIPAAAPLALDNIAYAIHFYAASHGETLRRNCRIAIDQGLPLLASEYGTCEANGDGRFAPNETQAWWHFLEANGIGHFNWSIADKFETAAALMPGASPEGDWPEDMLTPSGRLVRNHLRSRRFDGRQETTDDGNQFVGHVVARGNMDAQS